MNQLRQLYNSGKGGQPMNTEYNLHRIFLFADDEVLSDPAGSVIKCVDADYHAEDHIPRNKRMGGQRYFGWMQMKAQSVADLWVRLGLDELSMIAPSTIGGSHLALKVLIVSTVSGIVKLAALMAKLAMLIGIIAVPGLGANPIDCWKYTGGDSRAAPTGSSTSPKATGSTQTAETDASKGFNWLTNAKGLISQFPRARIMLYQYASAWRGDYAVRNPFDSIASGLLEGLMDNRDVHQDKRPIIFIGHSMGGLVIAKAMCLANAEPRKYAKVYKNVTTCFFSGTPFHGAQVAQLAVNYCEFRNLFRTDDDGGEAYYDALLRFMTWKNLDLLKLTTEFITLSRSMQPEITFFCFWELKSVNWRKKVAEFLRLDNYVPAWALSEVKTASNDGFFVSKESAVLEDRPNKAQSLSAYHEDLIRFSSQDDQSYNQVLARIRPFICTAVQTVRSRLKQKYLDDSKVARIRSLLESSINMRVKLRTLSASSPADGWLLQQPAFSKWYCQLDGAPNCLCIQGPPGYGKTAAAIATTNFVDTMIRRDRVGVSPRESLTLLACFFCDTQPGCSTAEDLLRSIILQLIEQAPALATYAENFLDSTRSIRAQHPESTERLGVQETCFGPGQGHFGRWFFTTSGETREDISKCFGLQKRCSNVSHMNLEDSQFANQVKVALTNYVREQTHKLKAIKGYDYSLAFEVEKIIDSKAENKRWVDVLCLQLQTLPDGKDRLMVKERLEAAASGSLRKLIQDAWLWELSVLTDYNSKDLSRYVDACAPMASCTPDDGLVVFVSNDIRASLFEDWLKLLESSRMNVPEKDRIRQIAWQHGYLAWKCFSYLEELFQPNSCSTASSMIESPSYGRIATATLNLPNGDKDGDETLDRIHDPSQNDTGISTLSCTYAIKNWMYRVAGGGINIAQSLCTNMRQFWEPRSVFRTRWLEKYKTEKLLSEFQDLQIDEMTALHVTAALGLADLLSSLLESKEHKDDINKVDSNQYTPLHLAALNNHLTVVGLLLDQGAVIESSQVIASPLHLAAVGGHEEVMRKLLASKAGTVNDINALILAARISKPELFQDILEAGKGIWKTSHCEDALAMASYNGRLECVNALTSYQQSWNDACIRDSLLLAGVEDNWNVVTRLLDVRADLDYYDVFYLSATTLAQKDEILERIWKLAKSDIPRNIIDAALYRATDNEKVSTVTWLLEVCHANPNATADAPGELDEDSINKFPGASYGDALTAAAFDGNIELINILLAHKANVDGSRGAALQTAARQGHVEVAAIPLDEGAAIDRLLSEELMKELDMEYYSGTALQAACDYRNPKMNDQAAILNHLLNTKCIKVNIQGGPDRSFPLQSACAHMDLQCVERLLEKGADINAIDPDGDQAIHLAASTGNLRVLKFLLQHNAEITHKSELRGLAIQEALENNQVQCAILLADAIEPIFGALTDAAADHNDFAKSVITNPRGQHPRINTERYKSMEAENSELQARNAELMAAKQDYDNMKDEVARSCKFAEEKSNEAAEARSEAEDTRKKYGISIEGYDAAARERDTLRKKVKDLQDERDRLTSENKCLQSANSGEVRRNNWSTASTNDNNPMQPQDQVDSIPQAHKSADQTNASSIAPSETTQGEQAASNKERNPWKNKIGLKDTFGKYGRTRKKDSD
ncbi:hypothetical protein OPT61_g8306 [Boeremia exigua]|uniref:Uncharacterized protein n=1 Tax=Boeremia exigua TaxID=749465 RepID=A0ACC2HZM5_9PLEO|nr:hypothetical protein OPT61_g8306 [Boeremia exigua]